MKIQINCNILSLKILLVLSSAINLILGLDKSISQSEVDIYSKTLAEVFKVINNRAYFPVNFTLAMNRALDSFVHCDEYSHFLGPKDYRDLLKSTQGKFYGIGVAIAPKKPEDDYLLVLKVLPNSPAQKKDIQKYDKIIAINGQPVAPLTQEDAILKLRGEERYSKIKLDIIRNTKNLVHITVERDIVEEKTITNYYITNKKILFCSISSFTDDIANKLALTLKKSLKRGLSGIVLDLRDNPGGILQSAIDCAGLFLKKNSLIVVTKNRHEQVVDYASTKDEPLIKQPIPIIVLVNNYTASAAEILAGALQDHASRQNTLNHNIFLLGTETYGKSFVQEVIPLSNDCALKITTCLYHLPNGRSINKIGISPDFTVKQKYPPPKEIELIDKIYGKANKKNKRELVTANSRKNWEEQQKENLKDDYQVNCALNLIDLLNLGKKYKSLSLSTNKKAKEFLLSHSCICSDLDLFELE